jgi:hypothetical protein
MASFLHVRRQIAAIEKRRTVIILAKLYRFYYKIYKENIISFLLFPMVAVYKFLRRTDVITYNFHTFKTYFNEILDLIKKNWVLLSFTGGWLFIQIRIPNYIHCLD